MNAICHKVFQCHIPVQGIMPCLFLLQPLAVQCNAVLISHYSCWGIPLNFFAHVQIVKYTKMSLFIELIYLAPHLANATLGS